MGKHELCEHDLRDKTLYEINLHYFKFIRNATKQEREERGLSMNTKVVYGIYECKICGNRQFSRKENFKRASIVCDNNCNGVRHGKKNIVLGYNDLTTTYPELAKEWHQILNGDFLPTMVSRGYKKKVWWKCEYCGHEWETSPKARTNGSGCPKCAEKNHGEVCRKAQLKEENIVANKYPILINYFVNEEDFYTYTHGSHKLILFKCPICGTHKLMEVASLVSQIIILKNGFPCDNKECVNNKYNKMSVLWSGENNPSWQGGITPISKHLRNLPIVTQWKYNVRIKENNKCQLTGKQVHGGNSDVHHLYGFNMIVLDAHNTYNIKIKEQVKDYTEEELKLLEDYIVEWHKDSSNGILLSEEVHYLFHNCRDKDGNVLYGKGNNTPEQFEEFKERYLNGEFDTELKEIA